LRGREGERACYVAIIVKGIRGKRISRVGRVERNLRFGKEEGLRARTKKVVAYSCQ